MQPVQCVNTSLLQLVFQKVFAGAAADKQKCKWTTALQMYVARCKAKENDVTMLQYRTAPGPHTLQQMTDDAPAEFD